MTSVADLDEPSCAALPVQDDRGGLPLRGLIALAGSAAFALWTSLTCFVC